MIGPRFKAKLEHLAEPIFRLIHRCGVSPNALTLTGLGINILASLLLWAGYFTLGGLSILAAGLCDMLDGGVARISGYTDPFGAFLDSMIDRYSDLFLLMGILLYYAKIGKTGLVFLSCLAILGTVLIPYARARAESFIAECGVGLMERPERILFLSAGAIFHWMPVALSAYVLLTHVTVFQRIYHCRKQLVGSGSQSFEGSKDP